jgi:DNA repair protein RecN (Recombination protein N)
MLSLLKIKNLALVDDLTWELAPGLIGVTGETGAGKSIIVGALKLILGERADRTLIRTGEDTCTVEASFHLRDAHAIDAVLTEAGLEPCENKELLVKRVVSISGANKQFVNCSPVTIQVLKSIGEFLVDLHGPHDHQSLNSRDRQIEMLDKYIGIEEPIQKYTLAWRSWRTALADLEELQSSERASQQQTPASSPVRTRRSRPNTASPPMVPASPSSAAASPSASATARPTSSKPSASSGK